MLTDFADGEATMPRLPSLRPALSALELVLMLMLDFAGEAEAFLCGMTGRVRAECASCGEYRDRVDMAD